MIIIAGRVLPDYDFVCQACFFRKDSAASFSFMFKAVTMGADSECLICAGTGILPIPPSEVGLNGN